MSKSSDKDELDEIENEISEFKQALEFQLDHHDFEFIETKMIHLENEMRDEA